MDLLSSEFLGFSLNTAQSLAIRTSLSKLRINENNPNITFWGKINGTTRDYFIARGVSISDNITKTFYFSADDGLTFAKLPEIDDFIMEKSAAVSGMFTGNPSLIYKDPNAPQEEEEEEEEEDEDEQDEPKQADPSKRKLKELERLSHAVVQIDFDTCVVPRGASLLTPTGLIQDNMSFRGLSSAQSTQLSNYLLMRDARNPKTLARIRKLGVSNNVDFLDAVGEGQPSGVWIVQTDEGGTQTRVRSLVWPGYEFKLEANSSNYGGAYFGSGLKNQDVMFML